MRRRQVPPQLGRLSALTFARRTASTHVPTRASSAASPLAAWTSQTPSRSLGRGARFFIVSAILRAFGPRVRTLIEKHFDLAAFLFLVLLLGGFLVLRYF